MIEPDNCYYDLDYWADCDAKKENSIRLIREDEYPTAKFYKASKLFEFTNVTELLMVQINTSYFENTVIEFCDADIITNERIKSVNLYRGGFRYENLHDGNNKYRTHLPIPVYYHHYQESYLEIKVATPISKLQIKLNFRSIYPFNKHYFRLTGRSACQYIEQVSHKRKNSSHLSSRGFYGLIVYGANIGDRLIITNFDGTIDTVVITSETFRYFQDIFFEEYDIEGDTKNIRCDEFMPNVMNAGSGFVQERYIP